MKSSLEIHETTSALKRSFKATTKLNRELSTEIEKESIMLLRLSYLALSYQDIHAQTREATQCA